MLQYINFKSHEKYFLVSVKEKPERLIFFMPSMLTEFSFCHLLGQDRVMGLTNSEYFGCSQVKKVLN